MALRIARSKIGASNISTDNRILIIIAVAETRLSVLPAGFPLLQTHIYIVVIFSPPFLRTAFYFVK